LEKTTNEEMAARLREIRQDMYGEHGAQFLADDLGVPLRTWMNYESGIVMPAKVVLRLIVTANVNPHWLLTGRGEKYSR
jgi:hypothetical protein